MSFDEGFNFRQTVGFVTDPSDTQFVDPSLTYPQTSGGVTYGWDVAPSSGDGGGRDRNAGVDARLAGIHYWLDYQDPIKFRVDLPSAGQYTIHLAFGDVSYARSTQFFRIFDNTTVLDTATALAAPGAAEFYDATHVKRTSVADWIANEAGATYTFASTVFKLEIADPAKNGGGSTVVAHLRIVQSGPTPGPTAFQIGQSNAFQGPAGYRQKDIARTAFQENAFQENAFQIYGASTGSSDTNVNTNSVSMTLTTHRATISFDRNVATTSVAMTLTPHKATISDDYNVSTTSVALHLTTHAATISFDKNVATSSVAMTLTPHAATITVGSNDIEVFANVVSLVLTPHRADISLVAPSTPPAATQGGGTGGRFELINDDDEVIMAIIREFLEKAA